MMGKSRVYTRTGDEGLTSLAGGKRVAKTNIRLEAYGTIDELNSFIGLLHEEISEEDAYTRLFLIKIQKILFSIGGELATENSSHHTMETEFINLLEEEIDTIDASLPKLKSFVLPGGSKAASIAHICRTVCRRAERQIYHIKENEEVDPALLIFINRLSDYLFVLARKLCFEEKGDEILWEKP